MKDALASTSLARGHGDADWLAIVRQAWEEALCRPAEAGQTWEEAGGDSLASLHLLLGLERSLGRRLSFDTIAPDMTLAALARSLHPATKPAAAGTPAAPRPAAPTVFLLTGAFGDEPGLADFRRSFGRRLHFEVIEPPSLDHPASLLADLRATGRAAADLIARCQPSGDLLIAGYSFGGGVAFEAAHQLRAQGRRVAWLGIFDTNLGRVTNWRDIGFVWPLLPFLAGPRAWRRGVLEQAQRRAPEMAAALRQRLVTHFRGRAVRRWRPAPLAVPTLLAATDARPQAYLDAWARLCPGVCVLRLPTDHRTLFQAVSLALLSPAVEAAIGAALRAARSAPSASPVDLEPTSDAGVRAAVTRGCAGRLR